MAPAAATFSPAVAMPVDGLTALRIRDDSNLSTHTPQPQHRPFPTGQQSTSLGPRPSPSDDMPTDPASPSRPEHPMPDGDFGDYVDKMSSDRFIAPDLGPDPNDNVLAVDEGFCEGQAHEDTTWVDATIALWKANAAAGKTCMKGTGPGALAWKGVVKNRPRMSKKPRMRRPHLVPENPLGMAS
ncbi:hypothetical protein F5X68DRAFT_5595 [Plectosphaerella plurivora]|uniref:Uncharacterized protein n=1 Tax=Plectosphaerella plurivora TaxID=936078 RepID=A0A9P8VNN4_9PEZI|nr:hypothetical protein F5X68DRAFT_5595 [Plectosphaerella plurivora]